MKQSGARWEITADGKPLVPPANPIRIDISRGRFGA
jgi:hypothetical protein